MRSGLALPMGMVDTIIQKGEDATSGALDWTSSVLHAAADTAAKAIKKVETKTSDAVQSVESAASLVVHKVEDATSGAVQTVKADIKIAENAVSSGVKALDQASGGTLASIESVGSDVIHGTGKVLTTIAHEASNVSLSGSLMTALFPAGALIQIGYNSWKDLSSGNTLAVDNKGTAAQQIKRSGFEIANAGGNGGDAKLDLNSVFQKAAGGATGGGGPGAFDQVTAQQWQAVLPMLTAPVDANGRPELSRAAATGPSDGSLPGAQVGPDGIDFGTDKPHDGKTDATANKGDGQLKVVNGIVQYSDKDVQISAKDGKFTAQQSDGYTFKDDGASGRLVYLHGQEVFDLKADGTRVMPLSGGVQLTASADGKNVTVTDAQGHTQNFTLDQVRKQLSLSVGETKIGLASDTFSTASKNRINTGDKVTRGRDYVSIQGVNFTSIIKYTGEALVYSGDEAVHRHADGSYWYQQGKDGLEQKIDASKIESVTANADLQNGVKQLQALVDHGNGQIADRDVTLEAGVVQAQVKDKKTGAVATVKVDRSSSSVTEGPVSYVSTPDSPETKIEVNEQTVGTLTPKDDEIVVTTPDLVSSKEETTVSDGSKIHADGSMELSSGVHISRQGDIKLKNGTVIGHDNVIHFANGKSIDANQLSDQIAATAAQAQGTLASVSSGGGAVTMDQIIALECAIGQIGGLIDVLNQLGDVTVVSNLTSCQSSLETALDGAKDRYSQQSGRNFITNQSTTSSEQNAKKYSFLTAA